MNQPFRVYVTRFEDHTKLYNVYDLPSQLDSDRTASAFPTSMSFTVMPYIAPMYSAHARYATLLKDKRRLIDHILCSASYSLIRTNFADTILLSD